MKIYNLVFGILLLSIQSSIARLTVLDTEPQQVKLIKTLEMRFCYISFVNIDGETYIVKQKKSDCIRKIVGAVRDGITAHIAEMVGKTHNLERDLAHRVD